VVFCAGSSNFNGMYTIGTGASRSSFGTRAAVFHKVDGSETLVFYNGWWLFNEGGSGESHYGARAEDAEQQCTPPEVGWLMKHGQSPPPRVQCFSSLEAVPWQLREPGMLERSALDVFCAGSADFNGSYIPCGVRQGKLCYHKVGGVQMITFHKGWWLMNENGNGQSFYGCRAPDGDHVAPADATWFHKAGQAPAPRVQCHESQDQLATIGNLAPVEEEPEAGVFRMDCRCHDEEEAESGVFRIDCCYRVEASWLHYCFSTAGDVDHDTPMAEFGSEIEGERTDGWVKVFKSGRGMRFLPITLEGNVVMRDIDELGACCPESSSLSEDNLERVAIERTAESAWIETGKAEQCSVGSTEDTTADSLDLVSKDVSTPSGSLEAALVTDSLEFSSSGVGPAVESIEQDGIAGVRLEGVHAEEDCTDPLVTTSISHREEALAEHARFGQDKIRAQHANAPRPPQEHCQVQDTMPDSDEVKELRVPMRVCDSLRSEAEEMPCAGFVSQRVSDFTNLSIGSRSQSLSGLTDAPDRGLVSERIRAHQRFISGVTQKPLRCH
jgi:hypothetical protein